MHLTRFTDLGLRIVMQLAKQEHDAEEPDTENSSHLPARTTSATVAEAINASHTHVAKVVSRLAELDILISTRGRSGGIHLADHALGYPLGKLIWNLESTSNRTSDLSITTMLGAVPEQWPFDDDTRLQKILALAEKNFYKELNEVTIRDIAPICEEQSQQHADEPPASGGQAAITETPKVLGPQTSPGHRRI